MIAADKGNLNLKNKTSLNFIFFLQCIGPNFDFLGKTVRSLTNLSLWDTDSGKRERKEARHLSQGRKEETPGKQCRQRDQEVVGGETREEAASSYSQPVPRGEREMEATL